MSEPKPTNWKINDAALVGYSVKEICRVIAVAECTGSAVVDNGSGIEIEPETGWPRVGTFKRNWLFGWRFVPSEK